MTYLNRLLIALTCASVLMTNVLIRAQAGTPEERAFQVATIKPSDTEENGEIAVRGSQFITSDTTVSDLISFAYNLHKRQIVGGPAWLFKQRYDLHASIGDPKTGSTHVREMVAVLLRERFGLAFTRGTRVMPVLSISQPQGTLKLKNSESNLASGASIGFTGPGSIGVRNATLTEFAGLIQRYIADLPVINDTAIMGKYDFTLLWNPDMLGNSGAKMEDRPNLNEAFREQLGLTLSKRDEAAPILIVSHVNQPSPN